MDFVRQNPMLVIDADKLEFVEVKQMEQNDRFEIVYGEGDLSYSDGARQILVDKETGINYLIFRVGHQCSITPLLDSNGSPIVTR